MFRQRYTQKYAACIETSKDRGTLLHKEYIMSWLADHFSRAPCDVYLFFVGHGYKNGDLHI